MSSFIPPPLSPYISNLPKNSLTLITSTLGTSANWLIIRYVLAALLRPAESAGEEGRAAQENEPMVVLISWLRDFDFWKSQARRLGIGLNTYQKSNHLIFIDGLQDPDAALRSAHDCISSSQAQTYLILDAPTVLHSLSSLTPHFLLRRLFTLRRLPSLYAMIIAAPADDGFLNPLCAFTSSSNSTNTSRTQTQKIQTTPTPLEIETTGTIVGLAHQATWVLSLRGLTTGAARDVSGTIRATRGGGVIGAIEEGEWLYSVGGDGVTIWRRGEHAGI